MRDLTRHSRVHVAVHVPYHYINLLHWG